MADENYRTIEEKNDSMWFEGSPIIICAMRLELDTNSGRMFTSAKFMNIQPDNLRALSVDVVCYDEDRNPIDYITGVTFSGLDVERNADFGYNRRIPVRDINTRSVEYVLRSITNVYNQTWENSQYRRFDQKIEQKKIFDVLGDYNRQFLELCTRSGIDGTMLVFEPEFEKSHWLCACGGFNWNDERICSLCKVGRSWLEKNTSIEALERQKDAQILEAKKIKEQIQSQARLVDNKQSEKEEFENRKKAYQKQQRKQKSKRITKKLVIAVLSLALAAAAAFGIFTFVIPYYKYSGAISAMNNGKYDEAIVVFDELGDFMDCKSHKIECLYGQAADSARSENYERAAELFEQVIDYSDAKQRYIDANYNLGLKNMEKLHYDEAVQNFITTDNYKDSKKMLEECYSGLYREAQTYLDNGKYDVAYKKFEFLNEHKYKDSDKKMSECLYQKAGKNYANSRYDKALEDYNKIPDYKDTAKKLKMYEMLAGIIGTATDKQPADWKSDNVKCGKCGDEGAVYHISLDVYGRMICYYECENHNGEKEVDRERFRYKIEDKVIYWMDYDGKTNWNKFADIIKLDTSDEKSPVLTITSPIEKGENLSFHL